MSVPKPIHAVHCTALKRIMSDKLIHIFVIVQMKGKDGFNVLELTLYRKR